MRAYGRGIRRGTSLTAGRRRRERIRPRSHRGGSGWNRTGGTADQGAAGGDEAPGDHDAGDPDPRAEAIQRQVAGYFENTITERKNAGTDAELRGGEAEFL